MSELKNSTEDSFVMKSLQKEGRTMEKNHTAKESAKILNNCKQSAYRIITVVIIRIFYTCLHDKKDLRIMKFKAMIVQIFRKFAFITFKYAKNLPNTRAGNAKRAAVNFLLSRLPFYLKPLIPFFCEVLVKFTASLIKK